MEQTKMEDSDQAIVLGWLKVCINLDTTPTKGDEIAFQNLNASMYRQGSSASMGSGRPMNKRPLTMANGSLGMAGGAQNSLLVALRETTPDNVKRFLADRKLSRAEAVSQIGNDVSAGKFQTWLQGKSTSWNGAAAIKNWLTRILNDEERSQGGLSKRPRSYSSQSQTPNNMPHNIGMNGPGGASNNMMDFRRQQSSGGMPGDGNNNMARKNSSSFGGRSQYSMDDFIIALKAVTNKKHDEQIKKVLEVYVMERRKQDLTPAQKEAHGKKFIQSLKQICGDKAMSLASQRIKASSGHHNAPGMQPMSNSRRSSMVSAGDFPPGTPGHGGGGVPGSMKQEYRDEKGNAMPNRGVPGQPDPRMAANNRPKGHPGYGSTTGNGGGNSNYPNDPSRRHSQPSKNQIAELIRAWNHGCQCTNDNCQNETCRRIKPSIQHQRELKHMRVEARPCRPDCQQCNFYIKLGKLSQQSNARGSAASSDGAPNSNPGLSGSRGAGPGTPSNYPGQQQQSAMKGPGGISSSDLHQQQQQGRSTNKGTKQQVLDAATPQSRQDMHKGSFTGGDEPYYGSRGPPPRSGGQFPPAGQGRSNAQGYSGAAGNGNQKPTAGSQGGMPPRYPSSGIGAPISGYQQSSLDQSFDFDNLMTSPPPGSSNPSDSFNSNNFVNEFEPMPATHASSVTPADFENLFQD